jgi:hypothetical protein
VWWVSGSPINQGIFKFSIRKIKILPAMAWLGPLHGGRQIGYSRSTACYTWLRRALKRIRPRHGVRFFNLKITSAARHETYYHSGEPSLCKLVPGFTSQGAS